MTATKVPALRFECTLCADCCTKYIPLIVSEDVRRVMHHTGLPAREFVRFYDPDEVRLPARDRAWIQTRYGRRVLGLRKVRRGRCYFLKGVRCSIHAHKPLLCRMYPFRPVDPRREPTQFVLPQREPCKAMRGRRLLLGPLRMVYQDYSDTLWSYEDEVRLWNRESEGRGTTVGFLRFLGLE